MNNPNMQADRNTALYRKELWYEINTLRVTYSDITIRSNTGPAVFELVEVVTYDRFWRDMRLAIQDQIEANEDDVAPK